jgi:pSer/pThr/pTyr-binding forkhead associated (FHA) protein
VIGRGADADLRINDPGVSRRHAEIRVMPAANAPAVSIVDLGSTNGMLVNGQRVQQATLDDGAVVKIGNTSMTVRFVRPREDESDV